MKKKKLMSILGSAVAVSAATAITANAYAIQGPFNMVSDGETAVCYWTLTGGVTSKTTLTLTGDGSNMEVYASTSDEPWNSAISTITDIDFIKIGAISKYAFKDYDNLTDVTFDNKLWYVQEGAFYGCDKLTNVILPESVVRVHSKAFTGCPSLKDVYFSSGADFYSDAFDKSITIHYPVDNDMYRKALSWGYNIKLDTIAANTVYNINNADIDISLGANGYLTYTGSALTPAVTLKDVNGTAINKSYYTVKYTNNVNAGYATVTVTGDGTNVKGTLTDKFRIVPKSLSMEDITFTTPVIYYREGQEIDAESYITAKISKNNYKVDVSNDIGSDGNGTGKVTITGINNYAGSMSVTYKISLIKELPVPPAPVVKLTYCTPTLATTTYTYDGTAKKPAVKVTYDGKSLTEGTDYNVAYSNNINAGTGYAEITGKGNYEGSVKKIFTINAKSISGAVISSINKNYAYTGKNIAPVPTVKLSGKTLKSGTDYTASYKTNKGIGTATVTITGKGNYTGSVSTTFAIVPAKVTGLKASSTSASAITLKWNKITGVQGYYIYKYDTSAKKWTRIKAISSAYTSYKATGLKAGTTYKFAVRAYKKVGNTVYSSSTYPTVSQYTRPATAKYTVTTKSGKATLKWSKATGATGYIVYYKTASGKWKKAATTKSLNYTISGLKKGTTYTFAVKTYKTVSGKTYYGKYTTKSLKIK